MLSNLPQLFHTQQSLERKTPIRWLAAYPYTPGSSSSSLYLSTFARLHKLDRWQHAAWMSVHLSDSDLWAIVPPILHGLLTWSSSKISPHPTCLSTTRLCYTCSFLSCFSFLLCITCAGGDDSDDGLSEAWAMAKCSSEPRTSSISKVPWIWCLSLLFFALDFRA